MSTAPTATHRPHDAATAGPSVGRPADEDAQRARLAEQERRDAECLTFFVCLVTAAVTLLGLTLATDLDQLTRILLAGGITAVVGTLVHAVAGPEDDGL